MTAIGHVAINCRDLKSQVAFYMKHFGFRIARTFRRGEPNEFFMLRLGDFCLEMFQMKDPGEAKGGEQKVGFKHMAFATDDLEGVKARLEADGIKTENIIDCSQFVPGMKIFFFYDNEGNRIELMQGWKDE
jgi:glyoxylase I family protein